MVENHFWYTKEPKKSWNPLQELQEGLHILPYILVFVKWEIKADWNLLKLSIYYCFVSINVSSMDSVPLTMTEICLFIGIVILGVTRWQILFFRIFRNFRMFRIFRNFRMFRILRNFRIFRIFRISLNGCAHSSM